MTPFLKKVAHAYADNAPNNLINYCFVFPNKRSAAFFIKYLEEEMSGKNYVHPATTTISRFVAEFSPLVEATRYEKLFILYNEYKKLSKTTNSFDNFIFWGEMLVNDFNDVDSYLVDPQELFSNIKRLKEIGSNYLSPEQLDIINHYWGDEPVGNNIDHFWNHIRHEGENVETRFLQLWEVLKPLYDNYRSTLISNGLSTQGMYYRNAVNIVSTTELPFERYIFVGFNVLSASELKIFSILQQRNCADFYWDFNSPAFDDKSNPGSRFIKKNIKRFPSLYSLADEPTGFPQITIMGIPSNTGQAKCAGLELQKFIKSGYISNISDAIDTAIILPDESLFIPMIHSVPSEFTSLNVTMGFPVRYTPIASLIKNIIALQKRARAIHGEICFFFEDLRKFLTNPILQNIVRDECERLLNDLLSRRIYNVQLNYIRENFPSLSPFFFYRSKKDSIESVYHDLSDIIKKLISWHTSSDNKSLEKYFLQTYARSLDLLFEATEKFGMEMTPQTFLHLADRSIGNDTVNFTGEPLKGLQIMGVLETRSLDFKNIIMLSMNESVFPRKHYTRSFIPDSLRKGYGMATIEFQESIFSYYFYRLISKAEHVTFIYDARTVGLGKANEMSRYLSQLLYVFPESNSIHTIKYFQSNIFKGADIEISKTPEIMGKLKTLTESDSGQYFSASAFKTYISCPLNFYLTYIEGLKIPDELTDYMDASTYGSIVHGVAEEFYNSLLRKSGKSTLLVTSEMLDMHIKNNHFIDTIITSNINERYNHKPKGDLTPLLGEAQVLHSVILETFVAMLRQERDNFTPFTFISAEYRLNGRIKINDNITINFKQIIDRIDSIQEVCRIVDYKTGGDTLSASSIGHLFDSSSKESTQAIFQLMLYCYTYAKLKGYSGPITPVIYSLRRVMSEGLKPITIGKDEVVDYRKYIGEFEACFKKLVEEIFNPDIPFIQAKSDSACTFCKFKSICGREIK